MYLKKKRFKILLNFFHLHLNDLMIQIVDCMSLHYYDIVPEISFLAHFTLQLIFPSWLRGHLR